METIEVADEGHVPSLDNPDLISRISEFFAGLRQPRAAERGGRDADYVKYAVLGRGTDIEPIRLGRLNCSTLSARVPQRKIPGGGPPGISDFTP